MIHEPANVHVRYLEAVPAGTQGTTAVTTALQIDLSFTAKVLFIGMDRSILVFMGKEAVVMA